MTTPENPRQVEILLVEDNPADAELAVIGLKSGDILNEVHVVEDGESAMNFLHRRGEYENAPKPDIVLLDLNPIPVIVLTTSSAPPDISEAYNNYANSYMTKPVDFDDFHTLLSGLTDYWFNLVHLPSQIDN